MWNNKSSLGNLAWHDFVWHTVLLGSFSTEDIFKPMHTSFPAHLGWRMYCSNAVKHGSAKLCCTSTLISSEKSVTGRNLGHGRCPGSTLRGQQPLAELQPESNDIKGPSTCYASKFPSLLTRFAELTCDQRLQPGTNDVVDATRSHTNTKTILVNMKWLYEYHVAPSKENMNKDPQNHRF